MIKITALLTVIAFLSGFTMGGVAVYKRWAVAELKAQNEKLRNDFKKFRQAVGIAEELDLESDKLDEQNKEILHALTRKPPPPIKCDVNPVVIDADSMRELGNFK
jgi:cell shape-determining protein MreC